MIRHAERERRRLHIGVVSLEQANWKAGRTYTDTVLEALARTCDAATERVTLLTREEAVTTPSGVDVFHVPPTVLSIPSKVRRASLRIRDRFPSAPSEWSIRGRFGFVEPSDPMHVARVTGIDVLIPVTSVTSPGVPVRTVGWIPDFQHRFLPEMFSRAEIGDRDKYMAEIAAHSDRVILSSRDVQRHFDVFYPQHAHKSRVASFPSLFAFRPPSGDARAAVAKYHLPEKFALVVNQLWAHKNPEVVVDAAAICAARGLRIPIVMVGQLGDYRKPGVDRVSPLLQRIAGAGVWSHVSLLGHVPFADLVSLLRSAALILQPSRFEGWNTTVQDALALGRPVMCSALAVHREQAEGALGFFGCDRPDELAALLLERWPGLAPGPDPAREATSLAAAGRVAADFGQVLLSTCREAAGA